MDLAAFSQWTQKKSSWAAESFFHPFQHMWKGLRILLPLSKQKSELTGVLEGAVTTPWVDLQGLVYKGLRVRLRVQRNLHPNQPGLREENITILLPSILTRFYLKKLTSYFYTTWMTLV